MVTTSSFFFGVYRKRLARTPLARRWDYAEIPHFPHNAVFLFYASFSLVFR